MRKLIILSGTVSILIYWIIRLIFKRENNDMRRDIIKSMFAIYITLALAITFDNLNSYYTITFSNSFNLLPLKETISMFKNDISMALYQVCGNVVLFIPFGIFIPLLYKKEQNIIKVGLLSFIFSLLIEISQFMLGRIGDVDDLIFNTIGGIVGFITYILIKKSRIKVFNNTASNNNFLKVATPYCIVIFLYIHLLGIGSMYGFIKDNAVNVSDIRSQIVKSEQTIVQEEEIDGYNYIMSYSSKNNKDNIMITSYELGKKYVLDLYQNMITDNLHPDYVYKGLNGEFINYSSNVSTIGDNINSIIIYVKADIGDIIELSASNEKISFPVENNYMIKKIDLQDLELPQDTIMKINLIKNA